jgi:hypothetical protein
VDINKLVTRHSAVVGTTGAGKSTTVAGLLTALSDPDRYPSSRVVVLDIHGEYGRALIDRASVFRLGAVRTRGEKPLFIPFWALNFDEFVALAFGKLNDAQVAVVADHVVDLKRDSLRTKPRAGLTATSVTVDSPVPFCIHKLWLELHRREHLTFIPKPGGAEGERVPAYVPDPATGADQVGDAMSVTPPQFRNIKTTGPAAERVQQGGEGVGMRQQLAALASKLRDPRFAFLFSPGPWLSREDGSTDMDLDSLLADWIGGRHPIAVLDLSGVPSAVLNNLIGAMLRILFESLFWARNLPEGGRERPLLVVLEEAHAYLGKDNSGAAAAAVRRIAKEGRKYGTGIMLVSQRPSEIDSTILSQCGTIFAMRLANDIDRGQVTGAASDNLKGLFEMLPVLRTGEAIIVGEAVSLPVRTLIEPPPKGRRPDSVDPRVAVRGSPQDDGFDGPGGWNQRRDPQDYPAVVKQWRKQTAHYEHEPVPEPAKAVPESEKGRD